MKTLIELDYPIRELSTLVGLLITGTIFIAECVDCTIV